MAKYQFSVSGSQLTVSLVPVLDDVQPTSMTYLAPSFKIGVEKINVYEYGQPKQSFSLTEIGEINGVEPTDLQDAFDKLTSATASFNGGGLTDAQLRATPLPVSLSALPLVIAILIPKGKLTPIANGIATPAPCVFAGIGIVIKGTSVPTVGAVALL